MRLCHMADGGGAMRGGVGGQPWLLRRDGYGYVGTLLRLATPHALNPGGSSSEGSPCPEERSLSLTHMSTAYFCRASRGCAVRLRVGAYVASVRKVIGCLE